MRLAGPAGQEEPFQSSACRNCEHGTYKPAVGTENCAACAANSFSTSERAPDLLIATRTTGTVRAVTSSVQGQLLLGLALSEDSSKLYVADTNNHRIKKVMLSASGLEASPAETVVGDTAGSANGVGTLASLNSPSDIEISPDGASLLVADSANHLVRKIFLTEQDGSPIYTTTSIGEAGEAGHVDGTDGSDPRCRFSRPTGLRFHGDGRIFVADRDSGRIRTISQDFSTVTSLEPIIDLLAPQKLVFTADFQTMIILGASNTFGERANLLTEARVSDSSVVKIVGESWQKEEEEEEEMLLLLLLLLVVVVEEEERREIKDLGGVCWHVYVRASGEASSDISLKVWRVVK